ncbi:MAG: hypothetical protein WBG92_04150 [Thiohalocapsa sp.]
MDAINPRVVGMSEAEANHKGSMLDEARQGIRNLAARPAAPSLAAQIRQLLPDIEQAQACGVSRSEIVAELRRHGLAVSETYFATALSRARRKRTHAPGQRTTDLAPAAGTGNDPGPPRRAKRAGLAMPEPPPTFEWDPLERPNITFSKQHKGEK